MLILEIALGIILAWLAITVAPILAGLVLGAGAHVVIALTKPRGIPRGVRLSTVLWTVGICVAIFAGVCIEAYLKSV